MLIPVLALLTVVLLIDGRQCAASRERERRTGRRLAPGLSDRDRDRPAQSRRRIGHRQRVCAWRDRARRLPDRRLHPAQRDRRVGIAAPVVRERPQFWHFLGLALLAGAPAIIGTWIGAFTYSAFWTTIFLAVGIGAILQVIWEVGRLIQRGQAKAERARSSPGPPSAESSPASPSCTSPPSSSRPRARPQIADLWLLTTLLTAPVLRDLADVPGIGRSHARHSERFHEWS